MLKEVKLLKHDTCYTYMLKRIGICTLDNLLLESNDFISKYERETVQESDLQIGDILIFTWPDDPKRKERAEFEITPNREIVMGTHYYDIHFMVYEGQGLISHAILSTDGAMNVHKICMRRLCDGEPDWFRLKIT